jgi:hypothetical protein
MGDRVRADRDALRISIRIGTAGSVPVVTGRGSSRAAGHAIRCVKGRIIGADIHTVRGAVTVSVRICSAATADAGIDLAGICVASINAVRGTVMI